MVSILSRLSEPSAACRMSSGRLLTPTGPLGPYSKRRDDYLFPKRCERLADQFLIFEHPVHFGGIEKGDPALDRGADEGDHLIAISGRRAVALAHPHASEADGRDFRFCPSFRFCITTNLGGFP